MTRALFEALLLVALWQLYRYGRYAVRGDVDTAFAHAYRLVQLESVLGLFQEVRLQRLFVRHPSLMIGLNQFYIWAHPFVTIGGLVYLYARRRNVYRKTKRMLLLTAAGALGLHAAFPLAPPRMLPDKGFVDSGATFGPAAYGGQSIHEGFANQLAAMPSLHVGWAVIMALAFWPLLPRTLRWVALAYPITVGFVVVVTGNHYWADGLVALALVGLAQLVATRIWPGHHELLY